MSFVGRDFAPARFAWLMLLAALADCGQLSSARGQLFPSQFELSSAVHLDEIDSTTKSHLERVKAYIAASQWDEAVETLRQVMENNAGKVIGVSERRFVNVVD